MRISKNAVALSLCQACGELETLSRCLLDPELEAVDYDPLQVLSLMDRIEGSLDTIRHSLVVSVQPA